jgi:CheY-like chemotaxis protein
LAKKVLIVDNGIDARFLLKVHLRKFDVEFIEARDGESALELAQSEKSDLIVMDYVLPKLSGYEMIKRIEKDEATREIPIIITTIAGFDFADERIEYCTVSPKTFLARTIFRSREESLGRSHP